MTSLGRPILLPPSTKKTWQSFLSSNVWHHEICEKPSRGLLRVGLPYTAANVDAFVLCHQFLVSSGVPGEATRYGKGVRYESHQPSTNACTSLLSSHKITAFVQVFTDTVVTTHPHGARGLFPPYLARGVSSLVITRNVPRKQMERCSSIGNCCRRSAGGRVRKVSPSGTNHRADASVGRPLVGDCAECSTGGIPRSLQLCCSLPAMLVRYGLRWKIIWI